MNTAKLIITATDKGGNLIELTCHQEDGSEENLNQLMDSLAEAIEHLVGETVRQHYANKKGSKNAIH